MRFKKSFFVIIFFSTILIVLISQSYNPTNITEEGNKTIILRTHTNGNLSRSEFIEEVQDVYFFTGSKWKHERGSLLGYESNDSSIDLSAIRVPSKRNITFNFLWKVPSFGKTVLRLDLTSFKDGQKIYINEELSKQKYSTLKKEYYRSKERCNLSRVESYLNRSKYYLDSSNYLKSLNSSLWGLETLTMDIAECNINESRKEEYTVKVLNEEDNPLDNVSIKYKLKDPNFSFGWFGFNITKNLTEKMKKLGFNSAQTFAFWYETEPRNDEWKFDEKKNKLELLQNFNSGISGLIGDSPKYLSNLSDIELHREVREHVSKSIVELESVRDISTWECYGLGMHYLADKTLQMTDDRDKDVNMKSTKECIKSVHSKTNDSVIVTGWNIDGSEIRNSSYTDSPYRYYQRLDKLEFDIGFDFMYFCGAHEMYPNLVESGVYKKDAISSTRKNWIPARHLYSISKMLDWYSGLNRNIYIQYFQAPSNYVEGQQGYWHRKWDEDLQAEWIKKYYKLVYSKLFIKGINYLEVRDAGWKDLKTGIMYENGTPKKSYFVLKDLLNSWESSGMARTGADGSFEFNGYEGRYMINTSKGGYKSEEILLNGKEKIIILKRKG